MGQEPGPAETCRCPAVQPHAGNEVFKIELIIISVLL